MAGSASGFAPLSSSVGCCLCLSNLYFIIWISLNQLRWPPSLISSVGQYFIRNWTWEKELSLSLLLDVNKEASGSGCCQLPFQNKATCLRVNHCSDWSEGKKWLPEDKVGLRQSALFYTPAFEYTKVPNHQASLFAAKEVLTKLNHDTSPYSWQAFIYVNVGVPNKLFISSGQLPCPIHFLFLSKHSAQCPANSHTFTACC